MKIVRLVERVHGTGVTAYYTPSLLTLSCGERVSNTVRAASTASFILVPDIEPLRSIIMTRFLLTGEAVSTYHDLEYRNTTVISQSTVQLMNIQMR